jgi:polysaccharide export outer membrane protein
MRKSMTIVFLLSVFIHFGCVDTKKAIYFNNVPTTVIPSVTKAPEPIVQVNDLLSISVNSISTEATSIFNAPNVSTAEFAVSNGGSTRPSGYLVDPTGYIQFPLLGSIKVAGLAKKAISDTISNRLVAQKLLINPIVDIRLLNFKVTVLGEVGHPSVINVQNEKISLLEAIGLAGDLTIYAKRNNVMIVREEEKQKIVQRIDLNSTELFNSPFYYLKSNDVVYVEPNKERVVSGSSSSRWVNTLIASLSLVINVLFFIVSR